MFIVLLVIVEKSNFAHARRLKSLMKTQETYTNNNVPQDSKAFVNKNSFLACTNTKFDSAGVFWNCIKKHVCSDNFEKEAQSSRLILPAFDTITFKMSSNFLNSNLSRVYLCLEHNRNLFEFVTCVELLIVY